MTQIANPVFPDVEPMPASAAAQIGHNRPPPDEMVLIDFDEAIRARPGFIEKMEALIEAGDRIAPCTDEFTAGKYGDFIRQLSSAEKFIDEARVTIKAPYLAATRALDGKAKSMIDRLADVRLKAKRPLDRFMAEQAAKVEAERRRNAEAQAELQRQATARAEEERRRLQAHADAQAAARGEDAKPVVIEAEPVAVAAPPPVEAPVFRGDMGGRVGLKTVWRHKIEGVRKLPDAVLNHPTVLEAINKVLAARVRGGEREIKGCTIWSEQESSVR